MFSPLQYRRNFHPRFPTSSHTIFRNGKVYFDFQILRSIIDREGKIEFIVESIGYE
jgi:hypothetical protein